MKDNIKIIGIDLDGTLLHKKEVSERNKQSIRACLDRGMIVYLVTGRPYCFTKHIARIIDPRVKVIASNGGIYEVGDQIKELPIDADTLVAIISILEVNNIKAFLKGKQTFYTHEPYDERFLYDHYNEVFNDDIQVISHVQMDWQTLKEQAHDILKILTFDLDKDKLEKTRRKIEGLEHIEVTDYQKISFDITAQHVNKGIIMNEVLKSYKLSKSNFMAIGDSNNDIAMFEVAGTRVAMGNASDEIKYICDVVTASVDDDGVAKVLESYILKDN